MNKSYIEILNDEYLKFNLDVQERELLIQENNVEKRDVRGYHGREILELLQNADDAYKKLLESSNENKGENVSVLIEYKNNILTVSNSGTTFDKEGVKAIVQGNNSPKGSSLIGNKGTGFRSILNWANKVQIFSGDFNIEFSKDFVSSEFEKIKDKPQIKKQLEKKKDLSIPMLSMGKDIDPIEKVYDTVIKLYIDLSTQNDPFNIEKQITNIDENILLFLPCIDTIEIRTDKGNITYRRVVSIENSIKNVEIIRAIYNDSEKIVITENISSNYYLFEKKLTSYIKEDNSDDMKDIVLAIAIPQDITKVQTHLMYSYFPIQSFQSAFNCIMHATFLLDDQRNNIISSETNKTIYKELLNFLIEVARKFISNQNSQFSLSIVTPLLIPTNSFFEPKSKLFEYSDKLKFLNEVICEYIKKLSNEKLFPNILGEHLSFSDKIKTIDRGVMPKEFKRKEFNKLLEPIENEASRYLINRMGDDWGYNLVYSETELLDIVNSFSEKLTIEEKINIFVYWNKNFEETLPKLIKTQSNKYITLHEEYYFLVGDVTSGIPSWVRVPAIHSDYQELILKISESDDNVIRLREKDPTNHITRIISQNKIYPLVKFNYRDRSNIITTINSSIDNSYNKSIDFLKWLWKNYRKEENTWTPPIGSIDSPINYHFPTIDKNVLSSKKIFFGKSHGYALNNRLFSSEHKELIPFKELDLDEVDYEETIRFLSKFGVMLTPKIEVKNVKVSEAYKKKINDDILHGKDFDIGRSKYIQFGEFHLNCIDNLENILNTIDFIDIILWIISDKMLQNELKMPMHYNQSYLYIEYAGNLQTSYRTYSNVPNYILFLFNNTKWIDIDGNKYSPIEVLNGLENRNNIKFRELIPVITQEILKNIGSKTNISSDDLTNILKIFSFCDYPTDLSSSDFFKLMFRIPYIEFNKATELSQIIYRRLENYEFNKSFNNSENRERFLKEGKILVNYMNDLTFVLAKEAYCPSTNIIDKKGTKIVAKGQRTGNKNFIDLFGCQEYKSNYEVVKYNESQTHNSYFQEEYSSFIYFARAYSERNDNIKREIDRLEIYVVSDIKVIESNIPKIYDEDYTILKKGSQWFIILNGDYDNNKMSVCIENIFSSIAYTPGFNSAGIGELFREKERSNREFLITKEFGSLDVVYRYNNEPIKENFIATTKNINPDFDLTLLDKVRFENINSVDNFSLIKDILLGLNTDINKFVESGFIYKLDSSEYNCHITKDAVHKNETKYKNWLYFNASKDIQIQDNFVNSYNKFLEYKPVNLSNSIYYNPIKKLIDEFGDFTEKVDIDCAKIYSENYSNLNPDKLFEDEIANDKKVQTYIYFNNADKFREWILKKQEKNAPSNLSVNKYKRYENIVPKENTEAFKTPKLKSQNTRERTNGSVTDSGLEKRRRSQKESGNIAELLIYNILCEKYGENNVILKSEAFVELGKLKPGQASSGDYDLSYINSDQVEMFVEVKSSDGEMFYITPRELEFAKDHADNYQVFIVSINKDNPEESKYKVLPNRFWESGDFIMREVIERIICTYKL